ncbi:hypothetical protein [Microbacterium cremeum]|uniref:hypothetical protein n=1 Tax=Microbacterium cremeum TaxID=2782169 RepID=UPI0018887174|nr:hypothetical protein [Microbacterium cremeum]
MNTTLTPPPVTPTPAGPPPSEPSRSGAPRVIAIVAIVIGAIVIVGTMATAVVQTVVSASVHTSVRTADAAGVDELSVDVSAGALRVEFGTVSEAELQVTSSWGADRWILERNGDRLIVSTPDRFWRWFPWGWDDHGGEAVLRLPASLRGLDADLSLAAGELQADGEFGRLEVAVSAGRADVTGSADAVTVDLSAGTGDIELEGVQTAQLGMSAGSLTTRLTGAQPQSVGVDVSAGSLSLSVPDGDYAVTSEVSAGGFDNRIGSQPQATSTIDVSVSAGQVVLRSAD